MAPVSSFLRHQLGSPRRPGCTFPVQDLCEWDALGAAVSLFTGHFHCREITSQQNIQTGEKGRLPLYGPLVVPWATPVSCLDFPAGANGKEPSCQCWRYKRWGFDPWIGKIPWRREWQPTPVLLPGESHGQRSLVACSPQGLKESDTEWLSTYAHQLFTEISSCTFTSLPGNNDKEDFCTWRLGLVFRPQGRHQGRGQ